MQEARETGPVWPSGKAGKQKDLSSIPLRFSFGFLSKSLWFVDSLVTLPLTVNLPSKWLDLTAAYLDAEMILVASGAVSLFPHLWGTRFPPVPLRKQIAVKHV